MLLICSHVCVLAWKLGNLSCCGSDFTHLWSLVRNSLQWMNGCMWQELARLKDETIGLLRQQLEKPAEYAQNLVTKDADYSVGGAVVVWQCYFFFRGEVLPNLHEILTIYCNLFPVVACSQPCSSASSKEAHCGVPSARWLPWWWLLRIAGGIGTESRSTHGFAGPGLWMMFNPICRGVGKQFYWMKARKLALGKKELKNGGPWQTR